MPVKNWCIIHWKHTFNLKLGASNGEMMPDKNKEQKNTGKKPESPKSPGAASNPDEIINVLKDHDKLINVPKTLLKKEEWGMLTVLNLILAGIFPAYFVNILLISFFTEVGHLFTTHLTEIERARLLEFEKEFKVGYDLEKDGKFDEAVKIYEVIIPKYKDNSKIAGIAIQRIDWIEKNSPGKKS